MLSFSEVKKELVCKWNLWGFLCWGRDQSFWFVLKENNFSGSKAVLTSHWRDIAAFSQLADPLWSAVRSLPCSAAAPHFCSPVQSYPCERLSGMFTQFQLNWEKDNKPAFSLIYNYPVGRKLKWQQWSFHSLLVTFRHGVTLGKGTVIRQGHSLTQPISCCTALPLSQPAPFLPHPGMPCILLAPYHSGADNDIIEFKQTRLQSPMVWWIFTSLKHQEPSGGLWSFVLFFFFLIISFP